MTISVTGTTLLLLSGDRLSSRTTEIVTVRGTVPGEYVVNVHMYMKRSEAEEVPVSIQLDKINPYSTVMIKEVVLRLSGDEKTAFRFTVDKEGEVTDISNLEKVCLQTKDRLYEYPVSVFYSQCFITVAYNRS